MKPSSCILLAFFLTAVNIQAVTLAEVAGVYVGKMTATNAYGLTRFDQVTIIQPNGDVRFYLYAKGESEPQVVIGFINPLNADGTFPVPGGDGRLNLQGRHLTLTLNLPGLTTDFQGHRTEKSLALPAP